MATTIQVSHKLVEALQLRKMFDNESYESVIWDLIEDARHVNEETLKDIAISLAEIKTGKTISLQEMRKKYLGN